MHERLSVLDASFLALETPTTPMHTGGLGIFEPGLSFTDVVETVQARLPSVPLARKRLQPVPFGGRPAWVDDADFDLSFHLRHAALPDPGSPAQLAELASRVISRPLDRRRPLWELYVIEGVAGDRTGLLRKVHLACAGDGAGDVFSALLDEDPAAAQQGADEGSWQPWQPEPPPAPGTLAAEALRERAADLFEVGRGVRHLAAAPRRLVSTAASAVESTAGMVGRLLRHAPPSPLNVRLTPHRRFAMVHLDLDDLRRVRRAFGGTINDGVVTVVADAVGRLLRWRGYETTNLDLRVMVPVRVAAAARRAGGSMEVDTVGDGVVGVLAPLPVMPMDPVARLYRVMGELAGLRESRQAVAANDLVRLVGYAPPNLHAMAARLVTAEQRYNVALSNAPGPQTPRYLRGVRLQESYPYIPLAGDAALSVAVSSYAGGMFFGLLGDREATADLDRLAELTRQACADLVACADTAGASR